MDMLGVGLQGAAAAAPYIAMGAMSCWIAREVYGANNPTWLVFREWLFTQAPKWLLAAYLKHGERVADWLRDKELLKTIVRKWMDSRIRRMSRS